MDDQEEVRLTLRMPAGVRDKLLSRGKANGRSLNAEIVSVLERSIGFEDEYGTLEEVFREIWNDIDKLKTDVGIHDEYLRPGRYEQD